jgi:hypothetical protein
MSRALWPQRAASAVREKVIAVAMLLGEHGHVYPHAS